MFLAINIFYRLVESPPVKCIKMMSYPICEVFSWFWCECLQMNGLYTLFYEASSHVCELTMYMVWYQEEQCLKNINRLATLFVCLRNHMLLGLLHWKVLQWFFFNFTMFILSITFFHPVRMDQLFFPLFLWQTSVSETSQNRQVQNTVFFSSETWFYLSIFISPTHNREPFLFYCLQSRQ